MTYEQRVQESPERIPESAVELQRLFSGRLDAARQRIGGGVLLDRLTAFKQYLRGKYPDYQKRWAWHILNSSSLEAGEAEAVEVEGDFPGNDSVIRFLDSLNA